jgi:Cytochrome P460
MHATISFFGAEETVPSIHRLSALLILGALAVAPAATPSTPAYTPDGKLKFPDAYREWIFLSSGLDMSYRETSGATGHSTFDNVFVDPAAYRDFQRNGTWPDKSLLVLESRGAAGKGSINRHGKFQTTQRMGVEVHVKDTQRFSGGWAFFSFEGTEPASQIPVTEACYACHQQHAAVDTTFVQFYPTLLGVAAQKGTLAPGYRP